MIPWDKITVQAITQNPQRCIYFMIDVSWPDDPASGSANQNNGANGNHIVADNPEDAPNGAEDEADDSEGSLQELTEFYVVPDEADDVDEIYYVMSKFPVVEAMDDDEDSDENFFEGELDEMNLNDVE